jgi:hypothetical protein
LSEEIAATTKYQGWRVSVCATAHQRDDNNGADDRDDERTDTAKTVRKESEHIALSQADLFRGLFLYLSREYLKQRRG